GEVAQLDVLAVARDHHELADVIEVAELVDRADQVAGPTVEHAAAGEVDVLGLQALDDGVDVDVGAPELVLVEADLDLLLEPALDLDRGDVLERLEHAADVAVGDPAQILEALGAGEGGPLAADRQGQHRVEGRVVAQDQRLLDLGRQRRLDRVDLLEDV